MSLQVEKLEKNMAKLTIEVSADDLEKALQSAYMKQKNKISLPGFRKGKVPRQMIEKMYGAEIFYDDAANALIPKAYADAYDECELEIVSRPEIDEMAFARDVANQVIFMDDGYILEQGDPYEVFEHPKEERTKQFLSRFTQG